MANPKKRKRLPKNVEKLTADEVMRRAFGKRGQKQLKEAADEKDPKPSENADSDLTSER